MNLHVLRSTVTSLIWEMPSMPQNGLQFLLMIPTTLPVGFLATSGTMHFSCKDRDRNRKDIHSMGWKENMSLQVRIRSLHS